MYFEEVIEAILPFKVCDRLKVIFRINKNSSSPLTELTSLPSPLLITVTCKSAILECFARAMF